jgi:hypothetical protein
MRWYDAAMKAVLPLLLLAATPALSDATIGGKTVECYCTDTQGARVEMGEMICLHVDGKMFMARCAMSLNVPIWRKVSDGCLSSRLSEPRQPAVDAGGVDAQI